MDDSSGDDCPIGAREIVKAASRLLQEDDESNDSGSPMPEWISQHTPVQKSKSDTDSSSDSDEVVDLISPQAKTADLKRDSETKIPDQKKGKPHHGRKPTELAGPITSKDKGRRKAAKPFSLPPAGLSQAAAQLPAVPEAAANGGRIPIIMPEKIAKGRVLVELEATESGAADLAGDAGAVGRFSLSESSESKGMLLDLKGSIYSASMVPSATTLCIVNLQQTEAKVEALFDSFMSLKEHKSSCGNGGDEQNLFMFDDDDNYQMAEEAGEKPKKNTGKRKASQEAAGKPATKRKKGPVKAGKGPAGKAKPKPAKKKAPAKGAASQKK